jgi:hypothetical protein
MNTHLLSYRTLLFLLVFVQISGCFVIAQNTPLTKTGEFADKLRETSGLIFTPAGLFTLSDDEMPEICKIDPASASILQAVTIEGVNFSDKEALTFDGEYIYLGDFGNNRGQRKDLKIVKVALADIDDAEKTTARAEIIYFHYPEQKIFPEKQSDNAFDCEAMIAVGDSIYLFTKQRNDHKTTLYALPKVPGKHAARKISVFDAKGLITDAALSPDGKILLLLGYRDKLKQPFIWKFAGFTGYDFFKGEKENINLTGGSESWQTEGIAFSTNQEIYISCERTRDIEASLYKGDINLLFRKND